MSVPVSLPGGHSPPRLSPSLQGYSCPTARWPLSCVGWPTLTLPFHLCSFLSCHLGLECGTCTSLQVPGLIVCPFPADPWECIRSLASISLAFDWNIQAKCSWFKKPFPLVFMFKLMPGWWQLHYSGCSGQKPGSCTWLLAFPTSTPTPRSSPPSWHPHV